jgi:ferric-dicitrate binding protein FerR (iron transport regulator)
MTDRDIESDGKALWRRYRTAAEPPPAATEPDALALAAYLDGAGAEGERAAVEAWLASQPEHLDLLIAARASQGLAAPPPAGLVRRANDLLTPSRTVPIVAWAAAAAALLLVAVGGFEMGRHGYDNIALLDEPPAADFATAIGLDGTNLMDDVL